MVGNVPVVRRGRSDNRARGPETPDPPTDGWRSVDIGCGERKDGDFGIDFYPYPGVDLVCDLTRFPWPVASESFDEAFCHHVIEHLPREEDVAGRDLLFAFFDEVYRILRPGGLLRFDVPHAHGELAFADPTHRRFFVERAFTFLWDPSRDRGYERKIWKLVSLTVSRRWHLGPINDWHLRTHAPRVSRAISELRFGTPMEIHIVLEKPREPSASAERAA
jgi:SAM-dependent methyltransferase